MKSKNLLAVGLLIMATPAILYFQNCSKAAQFSAMGEVGQEQDYQAQVTRTFDVSPITDKAENVEPIKVLIVVDDSGTMANSQENLAKSVSKLNELLTGYESEVMVVTTTSSRFLVTTTPKKSTVNRVETTETGKMFNPNLQKFRIQKSMSTEQKAVVLEQLAEHIRRLGTSGSTEESPLRSIAYALEDASFFKAGDNALIYVITDEDDLVSSASTRNLDLNFLKYKKELRRESRSVRIPARSAPGIHWSREFYMGTYSTSGERNKCGPRDDFGNRECDTSSRTTWHPKTFATSAECDSYIHNKDNGKCKFESKSDDQLLDDGESWSEACQQKRNQYGTQVKSCSAKSIQVPEDIDNIPGERISTQSEYFLGMTENSKDLKLAIKRKLENLFSGNYLIAAQVNMTGQDCLPGPGQTYDKEFLALESVVSRGRMLRTSICEQAAVSGDILKSIATQLTINISNNYIVELNESERILEVYAIRDGQSKLLAQDVDYVHGNGVLSLVNLKSTEFEALRINVGLKENWHLQQ